MVLYPIPLGIYSLHFCSHFYKLLISFEGLFIIYSNKFFKIKYHIDPYLIYFFDTQTNFY